MSFVLFLSMIVEQRFYFIYLHSCFTFKRRRLHTQSIFTLQFICQTHILFLFFFFLYLFFINFHWFSIFDVLHCLDVLFLSQMFVEDLNILSYQMTYSASNTLVFINLCHLVCYFHFHIYTTINYKYINLIIINTIQIKE